MSKARDLGNLLDTGGDVVSGSLDNVPSPSKTSIEALGIDVPAANLTGSIANARIPAGAVTQHVDLIPLLKNIKINSLRIATLEDDAFNLMADGVTDAFTTEAGVNTGASTNETYNATTNVYENGGTYGADVTTANSAGTASASSTYSGSYPAWKAFNDATSGSYNRWVPSWPPPNPSWIEFDFNSSKTIQQYTVEPYNLSGPTTWTFEAYNGSAWVTLDTQTSITWVAYTAQTFTFANSTAYTKYRWSITAYTGDCSVNEMEMMERGANLNMTLVSNSITAEAEPTTVEALVLHEPVDAVTLGTDYTLEVSIDNGSNYDEITMTDVGTFDTGVNILRGSVDVSARTGTTIIWRQKTLNTKQQILHGIALGWS